MKPKRLPRKSPANSSFMVGFHQLPHFLNVWHFHEAYELVYIQKSSGVYYIGDYVGKFSPGDILLIGSGLPHMMLNDDEYFTTDTPKNAAAAIAVHFEPHCFGDHFFNLPELTKIRHLLVQAGVGLKIDAPSLKLTQAIEGLMNKEGVEQLVALIEILDHISQLDGLEKLASPTFMDSYTKHSGSKLDTVYEYMFKNFTDDITLEDVAKQIHMNPSSFSRFFKRATNKSFIRYLIELRIGHACKELLEDSGKNVSEICFESGFNSLSNFNKQFRNITKKTPSEYLKSHHVIN